MPCAETPNEDVGQPSQPIPTPRTVEEAARQAQHCNSLTLPPLLPMLAGRFGLPSE